MKRFLLCSFCFSILFCSAQTKIIRLRSGERSGGLITTLIDSLEVAEAAHDTVNIIRCAARLIGSFENDRADFYAQLMLRYATAYSDSSWLPDVYNGMGMFIEIFPRFPISNPTAEEKLDSAWYYYQHAVHKAMALKQYKTAAWGYRGLMAVALNNGLRADVMDHTAFRKRKSITKDSILFYHDKMRELATLVNDQELIISCNYHYANYMAWAKDWDNLKLQLEAQAHWVPVMSPVQKTNYYAQVIDYLAQKNQLDTLKTLKDSLLNNYLIYNEEVNKEQLYSKDQQYEVSKTKSVLDSTTSQLKVTSRVLIVSIITLVAFALLLTYLFFLFRKNKRLSQRNELLLREQNHRVKNNLQMISSLLSLQLEKLISSDAKDALEESKGRINSVALLHRMLYESENVGDVEVTSYIRSLAEEIKFSAGRDMEIELNLPEKAELKIEKVTSLGLIINELLTNSIKHVDTAVILRVRLHFFMKHNVFYLVYTDNGAGVAPGVWMSSESFGNQLIRMQSNQLKGAFEVSIAGGFKYELKISS